MIPVKINPIITERDDESLILFFKELAKIPMISIEEERELGKKIKEGDINSRNKLIEANLRFIVSVAKQYQGKGVPLIDLIQTGVIGATKAADNWDSDKGYKFITYAVYWIRLYITQSLSSNCRTVRIPVNQLQLSNKINAIISECVNTENRFPTVKELSEKLEVSEGKISVALNLKKSSTSLDTALEDNLTLMDIIPNKNSTSPDEDITSNDLHIVLESIINKLGDRDQDIIRLAYGIGVTQMSINEIGELFGVCGERIRQILKKIYEKLRRKYSNELSGLI